MVVSSTQPIHEDESYPPLVIVVVVLDACHFSGDSKMP